MKILNTTDFAKLPEGVLFSEYQPCVLGDLKIKGETVNPGSPTSWAQWYEADLNQIEANDGNIALSLQSGDFSKLNISYCRAVYPHEQLWAVWEVADLFKLAEIVDTALDATEFRL
jgi:hypothetical protein